jgi:hypothetical protein
MQVRVFCFHYVKYQCPDQCLKWCEESHPTWASWEKWEAVDRRTWEQLSASVLIQTPLPNYLILFCKTGSIPVIFGKRIQMALTPFCCVFNGLWAQGRQTDLVFSSDIWWLKRIIILSWLLSILPLCWLRQNCCVASLNSYPATVT